MTPRVVLTSFLVGIAAMLAVAGCSVHTKDRSDQMVTLRNAKMLAAEVRDLARRRGGVLPKSLGDPELSKAVAAHRSLHKAGGPFVLNPSIAGSRVDAVGAPESTVVVYESVAWPDGRIAVGYLDGHSELSRPFATGTTQKVVPKPEIPKTVDEAHALVKRLPSPYAVLKLPAESHLRKVKERALIDGLSAVALADMKVIEGLYPRETDASDSYSAKLFLLNRLVFRVEDSTGRKRFGMFIDDGAKPNDWLYPLERTPEGLRLRGRGHVGVVMGWWPEAVHEFRYVRARVRRR